MTTVTYITCTRDDIPADIRWDVPRQNQGQIVEVAYAEYPARHDEACHGARYKRVLDRSDNSLTYARRR